MISKSASFSIVNNRHKRTLRQIFANPPSGTIRWNDIEALLVAVGCRIDEGRGSRVRVVHEETMTLAVFHRPHPRPETDKGAVKSVREFLETIGVTS